MKRIFQKAVLATALSITPALALADIVLVANLTPDQEVTPPVGTFVTSGTAIFVLNDAQTRLTYDLRLTNLDLGRIGPTGNPNLPAPGTTADPSDDVLRIHIHRGPAGVNGGIVFGMVDASLGLRNDPNDLLIDAANFRVSGAWDLTEGNAGLVPPATLATELNNLLNRGLYINVHTSDNPGGEIRGQIRIPEPGSIALLGLGLIGLLGIRRRVTA